VRKTVRKTVRTDNPIGYNYFTTNSKFVKSRDLNRRSHYVFPKTPGKIVLPDLKPVLVHRVLTKNITIFGVWIGNYSIPYFVAVFEQAAEATNSSDCGDSNLCYHQES
jgi:hypothetical protein